MAIVNPESADHGSASVQLLTMLLANLNRPLELRSSSVAIQQPDVCYSLDRSAAFGGAQDWKPNSIDANRRPVSAFTPALLVLTSTP